MFSKSSKYAINGHIAIINITRYSCNAKTYSTLLVNFQLCKLEEIIGLLLEKI